VNTTSPSNLWNEPPALAYPPFRPPALLRNRHMQTLIASQRPRRFSYGWCRWEPVEIDLGKEGKLLAEASWQPGDRMDYPALVLFHGLEGSARSHYLMGISHKAFVQGFHTLRVNMRNCGGTERLTPTLYCAALSQDVLRVAKHLREAGGLREVYAAAVSLGASMLLKFLGEMGADGPDYIRGAAAVSPPLDLAMGARRLLETQNWLYQKYFVRSLIRRMRRKAAFYPSIADLRQVEKIRTVYEFDDLVTAPHFGYASAEDYYRKASCGPLLTHIRVPTLILQAQDDPLIPFDPFVSPGIRENPCLQLLTPRHGGHAGFLGSRPLHSGDLDGYWAESRLVQFLSAIAARSRQSPRWPE
jgi:predicted alpha/beta-fold hydrolase